MRAYCLLVVVLSTVACEIDRSWADDTTAGKEIAREVCSACHSIDLRASRSPNPKAPPFRAIAQMSSTTETSLAVFLTTSHEPMPNFALSREEIRALTAYILSLRRHTGRTVHQRYK
jgi:mono/diheme cytochrome c family protein